MRGMWNRLITLVAAGACAPLILSEPQGPPARGVQVVEQKAERRVDVMAGGSLFTSYRYPESLQKPVLYPIRSAAGVTITRGYPLEPRAGEAADHPHHVGHWFNYGDVNGYDFWGHSDETPAANKPKMGTIVHTGIARTANGTDAGSLSATADWKIPDGSTLLKENVQFVFQTSQGQRTITRITTWTAAAQPVTFKDTKEGAFGIRVARALDHPSQQAVRLVGADGKPEPKPRVDNSLTTGHYLASDGKEGEAVWGTRGPWMALTGTVDGHPVTIAILDHPSNHGYPTYWHARGYGLFAANPFGRQGYDPKQEPAVYTLKPGQSMTFRHRIVVADSHLTRDAVARESDGFARDPGSTR
jgi:hypothetical protein